MDEQQQNEEIRKGFNAGYLMEKLNPELAKKLREGISETSNAYMLGFNKGAEQHNQEHFFNSSPEGLPNSVEGLEKDSPNAEIDGERDNTDKGFEP